MNHEGWGTIVLTGCRETPPETDSLKFCGTYFDVNPCVTMTRAVYIHPHDFLNCPVFLDYASVRPIEICQHCSSSERAETQAG